MAVSLGDLIASRMALGQGQKVLGKERGVKGYKGMFRTGLYFTRGFVTKNDVCLTFKHGRLFEDLRNAPSNPRTSSSSCGLMAQGNGQKVTYKVKRIEKDIWVICTREPHRKSKAFKFLVRHLGDHDVTS